MTRNPLRTLLVTSTSLAALLLTVDTGAAQTILPQPGVVVPPGVRLGPDALILNPGSTGGPLIVQPRSARGGRPGYAHTNILRAIPRNGFPPFGKESGPPFTGYTIETPASLACIYQMGVGGQPNCNPNSFNTVLTGGTKAIAVVDAQDYGQAAAVADLNHYSAQFGLAPNASTNLHVIFGTGSPSAGCHNGSVTPPPATSSGWAPEEAIDMEMAHAMAPNAQLYLVEAASSSFTDLFNAVQVATACVSGAGGGEVSMSFGGSEFSGETSFDSIFTGVNVVYFASSGDSPGVFYPCTSPNVICMGGTTISRNQQTGNLESEATWNWGFFGGTGGGPSTVEARPSYQSGIAAIINGVTSSSGMRGVPDLAAIANPDTGIWVYSTAGCSGWCIFGGTSVSSPLMAGIFNAANFFYALSFNALNDIYPNMVNGSYLHLVTGIESGVCGPAGNSAFGSAEGFDPANIKATTGIPWSFCGGWGSPKDAGNPNWLHVMNLRAR